MLLVNVGSIKKLNPLVVLRLMPAPNNSRIEDLLMERTSDFALACRY